MANTKKDIVTEAEVAKTATAKTEAKKEKMVTIRIPRLKGEEGDVFVSINDRTWLIQRGVEVEVPECVAKVLRQKEQMEEEAYAYQQSVQSVKG